MELCTLLKNFPKKTTVFLIYQEMELKKLFHTSENGTFLYFLKRKLSYISENGNPKKFLYFRKRNFIIFQKMELYSPKTNKF